MGMFYALLTSFINSSGGMNDGIAGCSFNLLSLSILGIQCPPLPVNFEGRALPSLF